MLPITTRCLTVLYLHGYNQGGPPPSPYAILPDDKDVEVPTALSNDREKINGDNLNNLVNMTTETPLDTKHIIDPDQEILAAEHTHAELLIWNQRLGHLPFRNINILVLLGIIHKRIANTKTPK